ncbi:hypothetical protein BGZ54_008255 [Gamsiella multidivaricata]|nr:hypothetical protein BGZ54_008255 [Gamsiella multidivaricata]
MWNDPDLDTHRDQQAPSQYRSRERRNQDRKKEDLTAFGYESFLFHADGVAEAIEQGQLLITWQGQDPADENVLWLDRYDVRNLLDDERSFSGSREIRDDNFLQETSDLDENRYEDLDSDEELLFDMDEDEREEHLARKKEENEQSQFKGVGYDYDKDSSKQTVESIFQLHFDVPEGMTVPDSEKTLALIERTAKFVNNSSEPTMEIILQAKQATNPNFAFMSRRHHLFQFYKHVRWLMQTGLYESAEEVELREAEEAKAEQEEEARRAAEAAKAREAALHVDIEKILEKTIEFLSGMDSVVFEEKLLSLDDPRFEFMKPNHAWHEHYISKRREATEVQARYKMTSELNPSVQFRAQLEMQDQIMQGQDDTNTEVKQGSPPSPVLEVSSREARAAEMRRLDRLQRVRELLRQRPIQIKIKIKVKFKLKFKLKFKFKLKLKVEIKARV